MVLVVSHICLGSSLWSAASYGFLSRLDLRGEPVGTDVASEDQYLLVMRLLMNARCYVNEVDW